MTKDFNSQDNLTTELHFLINCCKTNQSKEDIEFILSYLDTKKLDINTLVKFVTQHGVLPLVYKTIKKIVEDDSSFSSHNTSHARPEGQMPLRYVTANTLEHLLTNLKSAYSQIAHRNILMSAELIKIMKLLADNDITALTFKGPTLSEIGYGDITLRQYSDLDVLVDEKEIAKAGSVLEKYDYTPAFPIKILKNKTCREVTNDLGFYNEKNGILIELHWKLFREKIGQHLYFSKISENKQNVNINNKAIPTLSHEMLLVYLCLHGSKHAWERVEWICDIDRLIYSNKEIDWEKVLTIAQEMDTSISLYLGLKLSYTLFGTPLPEKIILVTNTERIENLITKTYTMLNSTLSNHEGYNRYNAIHMYQMDLLDTKLKKLKHLFSTYFGISRNDCQSFPLPSALKFLYIVIKPFRVLMKYIQYGK